MPDKDDRDFTFKSSIPQLFYDIIARIVPGAVIIGVLALAAAGPEKSAQFVEAWLNKPVDKYPSIIVLTGLGFVLSYTIAILLLGVWNLISHALPKTFKSSAWDDEFPMKYDYIKSLDPVAGSRITKLTAEKHMAGILALGLVLALAITIIKMVWFWTLDLPPSLFVVVFACGIAGSVGAFLHFVERQNNAINNYAKLLGFEAWKNKPVPVNGNSLNETS